jgi:vancomycin resistance protein YoaR
MSKKKQSHFKRFLTKKIIITASSLVLIPVALILFLAGWLFLSQRIYPNVSVAGIDVSLLKQDEAFNKVSREISKRGAKTLTMQLNMQARPETQSYNLELSRQETVNPLSEAISEAFDLGRKKIFFPTASVKLKLSPSLPVKQQLETISSSVNELAIDSTLKVYEGEITVTPSQNGTIVDEAKVYAMIEDYFNTGQLPNPNLPLKVSEPELNFQEASSIKKRLDEIKDSPIKLTFENLNYTLDLNTILSLVDLENSQDSLALFTLGDDKFNISSFIVNGQETSDSKLTLNRVKLGEYLKTIANDIDRSVQEPLFSIDPSSDPAKPKITEFRPPLDGRQLQIDESVNAINAALISSNQPEVKLPVKVVEPKNRLVNDLGIKELIGQGISHFAGSIENRKFNVGLAASRINGVLIPPGEEFSFVKTVGDISGASGYKQAYVIKSGRTVLDDGGGVCQVSTTIYRAALNTGLPITERTAHAYRVGYYEQGFPPGLDATIFSPSVDLKFKNDTSHHILIQARVEGTDLTVDLYGTSDGRQVEMTKPVIVSQSPALPEIRQDDPTLPKGTIKQVDFAAAGANVVFKRKVTKGGITYIDETVRSNFRPWQAVFLVGTKES